MILHLFKTDLRRTRLLLLIWLLLIALQCALMGSSVRPGDQVMGAIFSAIAMIVPMARTLLFAVLIPSVVQQEPLVGTTAFWFTRPILRSALLGSKALFAGLLIALPLLAEIGVLAANGVTAHDIGLAIPEIFLTQFSFILALAALAALTPSFGRFAIAGAVVIVVGTILSFTIQALNLLLHSSTIADLATNDGSLIRARTVASDVLLLFGSFAVLVNQYLTRRTARSFALAGAVALGTFAIGNFWAWNFLAAENISATTPKLDTKTISISLQRTTTQDLSSIRGTGKRQKDINAKIDIAGLPAGLFATIQQTRPRLTLENGTTINTAEPASYSRYTDRYPNIEAIEAALGGMPVVNPTPFTPSSGLLTIEATVYNQYVDRPLKLNADIDFVASKYEIVAELPLVIGSNFDRGSEHEVITDVLRQGNDDVEIDLAHRQVRLLFSRNPTADNRAFNPYLNQGDTVYLLRNKKRNQAVLTKRNMEIDYSGMLQANGNRLIQRTLRLPFGREQFTLAPSLNEAWLADAELVRLERVPVGTFSLPFAVENFKLNGQNAHQPHRPSTVASAAPFDNLKLPANASKEQVKEYVEGIILLSQRRNTYRRDDPQVDLLAKVGSANVDVLLEAADRIENGPTLIHLNLAIQQLARPEDKAWVLRALASPAHRDFIDVVNKYHWTAEAHDTLVAALKDEHESNLPKAWIQAIASFKEPASYPDLAAYLVRCNNRQQTFNAIRKLPGIDLHEAVDAGWKKAKQGNQYNILDGCAMAADYGHTDALEALISFLKGDDDTEQKRAATIFKRHTPATGDNASLIAWYEANRENLTFDDREMKFLAKP